MPYNRLVGLEKGNCAFLGSFLMSAAGGFGCVCIHARARVRVMFRKLNKVGSACPFADKFRKQNTGFPSLFRKLNSVGSV
jgi:hypothetical protein